MPTGSLLLTLLVPATTGTTLSTPFDTGVIGIELSTPFDGERANFFAELSTPFNILGAFGTDLSTPFDLLSPLATELSTPFDMVSVVASPTWGNTTDAAPISVTLLADANTGDTVVSLTSTAGLHVGSLLRFNAPEIRAVAAIIDATDVELAFPLSDDHLAASAVTSLAAFQPVLNVFTKGGAAIGAITDFSVTSPPTQAIMSARSTSAAQGQMVFMVPRTLEDGQTPNPDADLIDDDRLVSVGLEIGGPLWAGSIEPQEYSGGNINATCFDLFAQFNNTPEIVFEQDIPDGTTAWSLIQLVLDACNTRRAADGELLWAFEHTGSKPYRGARFEYTGDIIGALEDIVANADIELLWRADVAGSLTATLIASDRFETASAFVLRDENDGQVMARPSITRDPSQIVHEITLTGAPTDLSECVPDYAQWAIKNSTPTVTVSVDPGTHRRRAKLDISVPWGYSKATLDELCQATMDSVWDLYYSFLRAIHDMEGRPFHDGYLFNNDRQTYFDSTESGSHALSRETWRTRLQLVETFPDTPASAIMISDANCLNNRNNWLIVTHNRQTGVTMSQYWGIPDAAGASMTHWHLPDGASTIIYNVSGTRITARDTLTVAPGVTEGTGAFCESYNTRVYDPVTRTYRNLRRIISGGYVGRFLDPADPDITFEDLGAGAGIDANERSQLIGKIYDFEVFNIEKWDPYRDGVGMFKSALTVFNGAPTNMERWHVISYNAGANASTSLTFGISETEQQVLVDSYLGFPTPEDPTDFPFKVAIDDGLDREVVLVDGMEGLDWHVIRGQDGTTAIIHEAGAPITRIGGNEETGLTPTDIPWPEGEAYALELLARLSQVQITMSLQIANIDDAWRECDFGMMVGVVLDTEGPGNGIDLTGRVIARSPDPFGAAGPPGSMEIVMEFVVPELVI